MQHKRRTMLVVAGLLVAACAGCADSGKGTSVKASPGAAGSAATELACAAAQRVLGPSGLGWLVRSTVRIEPGQLELAPGGTACVAETDHGQVQVSIERFRSVALATQQVTSARARRSELAPAGHDVLEVSGVGDEAFSWSTDVAKAAFARRGAVVVGVTVVPVGQAGDGADALEFAKALFGVLPA